MKVVVDVHGSVREPYMRVQDEHVLAMMLRHGAIEVGTRRSSMQRVTFQAGEIGFLPRRSELWVGTGNQERLLVGISDTALRTAGRDYAAQLNSAAGAEWLTRDWLR